MLVLRCTAKAFRELGAKPQPAMVLHTDDNLGEWYVNTIDCLPDDRMLACMHPESLFILLVPLEPGMDAADFGEAFRAHLYARLLRLETPPQTVEKIVAAYGTSTVLAKNTDRRVAGHLNAALAEIDRLLQFPELNLTESDGRFAARLEQRLNETPRDCSRKEAIWPLRAFWRCLIRQCPELPPRTTLPPTTLRCALPARSAKMLGRHLPTALATKLEAALHLEEALFTADEFQALRNVSAPGEGLAASLPGFAAELHRLASLRLQRLGPLRISSAIVSAKPVLIRPTAASIVR